MKIKLVVYDFDGVLTDNRVMLNQDGVESVICNRSDGWWVKEVTKLGLEQLILSTEMNPVVSARARKIGIEASHGHSDKRVALEGLLKVRGLEPREVCYVGNAVNDLGCFELAGTTICPKDSDPEILSLATIVLPVNGGAGVLRHVYEFLKSEVGDKPRPASIATAAAATGAWKGHIEKTIAESIRVKQAMLEDPACVAVIEEMGSTAAKALAEGKKVLFAGNGGSFADSMHLAAEFVSKLQRPRDGLPSLALGCSNSNLTAIGNDYGYEHVFEREIAALGQPGDVFFAISTSGNSKNIVMAVRKAREMGLKVFGWSGMTGGKLAEECTTFRVPSPDTARIQECHIVVGHLICEIAEAAFVGGA